MVGGIPRGDCHGSKSRRCTQQLHTVSFGCYQCLGDGHQGGPVRIHSIRDRSQLRRNGLVAEPQPRCVLLGMVTLDMGQP